ncbi:MAG: Branched-chain amino acid aminotransferase [Labilithrix sp.]|nr:Branched-chain amino acid aminotransferase [Labilithrix sp.]
MAITAPLLWLDGELVDVSAATTPLLGHAAQRGSLVFDVGSFHRTRHGVALFRPREHVERLVQSARIVGLGVGFDVPALVDAAALVVARCGGEAGLVRWSVLYASGESDLLPRDARTRVVVAAQLLEDTAPARPLRVAMFDDARKASADVLPPEAKVAAAYLGPMLARRRAQAAGADDVVLLDRDGNLAEAPVANVFVVKDGVIRTPALGSVLPGITRATVLELAREEGLRAEEVSLPARALTEADEAFFTGTPLPLRAVGEVDGRSLGDGREGPLTRRLSDRLRRVLAGEDPAHAAWLHPV